MQEKLRIAEPDSLDGLDQLQRQVWNCSETDIIPSHLLKAQQKHGACLLCAWQAEEIVGFVYAFPTGTTDPKSPYLYSHLAAVRPEFQGQGIGRQLKLAQADWARQRGYQRLVWTYDPLQAANASLNIGRLGATCRRYLVNYYGDLDDDLNRGVATDRFEVDWWLNVPRPNRQPSELEPISFPWPLPPASKQDWRLKTRAQFQQAFDSGLSVLDFQVKDGQATYWLGVFSED